MKYILDKITPDMQPLKVAVVHPVDENSLRGAFEAAAAKLIVPVLVGPEEKIKKVAAEKGIDISAFEIVATEHSHAAALKAVELIKEGKAEGLMKGSLHTDEFLLPIVKSDSGMRTDRRMSHVFVMQVPGRAKPVWITDAALNVAPTLMEKRDIIQNAADLFWKLEGRDPLVAVVAATEEVNPGMPATLEAAALSKMADRKQIKGAKVDGPLAFDNAVSEESAKLKGIFGDVAGKADILAMPDIEAGNMVFKALDYMAQAELGGVVLGARVPGTDKPAPIILTSRSDGPDERKASAALALLNVRKAGRPK